MGIVWIFVGDDFFVGVDAGADGNQSWGRVFREIWFSVWSGFPLKEIKEAFAKFEFSACGCQKLFPPRCGLLQFSE